LDVWKCVMFWEFKISLTKEWLFEHQRNYLKRKNSIVYFIRQSKGSSIF
jgi:hypothetical protein